MLIIPKSMLDIVLYLSFVGNVFSDFAGFVDCNSPWIDTRDIHSLPGAPKTASDCMHHCNSVCVDRTNISCLTVGDSLAGCSFNYNTETTYPTEKNCAPMTAAAHFPAAPWSNMYISGVKGFTNGAPISHIYFTNSTNCSTELSGGNIVGCTGGDCRFNKWVNTLPNGEDMYFVVRDTEGKIDLSTSVNITLYTTWFIYGEAATCKGIKNETECIAAGCSYCHNLQTPTNSGYSGCGVSPTECDLVPKDGETTTTTPSTATRDSHMTDTAWRLTCHGVPTRFQYMSVQDVSGSYSPDLPFIQDQLPRVWETLLDVNNDSVFGLLEFRDRTDVVINNLTCAELSNGLTNDVTSIKKTLTWPTSPPSGGDAPEDSWSAAYYAAALANWKAPIAGFQDRRVIAISTNEGPHYENDTFYNDEQDLWIGSGPFQYNNFINCSTNYPDFDTVSKKLIENDIYLVLLLRQAFWPEDVNTSQYWHDLIQQKSPDLLARTVIIPMELNSSNLFDAAVEALTKVNCEIAPPLP